MRGSGRSSPFPETESLGSVVLGDGGVARRSQDSSSSSSSSSSSFPGDAAATPVAVVWTTRVRFVGGESPRHSKPPRPTSPNLLVPLPSPRGLVSTSTRLEPEIPIPPSPEPPVVVEVEAVALPTLLGPRLLPPSPRVEETEELGVARPDLAVPRLRSAGRVFVALVVAISRTRRLAASSEPVSRARCHCWRWWWSWWRSARILR